MPPTPTTQHAGTGNEAGSDPIRPGIDASDPQPSIAVDLARAGADVTESVALRVLPKSLGVLRIALGFVLGWAFLDKIFGFGLTTPPNRSVLSGASATAGYLGSRQGTFAGLFQAMSGHWWIDVLFLLGLGGGAIALLLGIASRLGTVAVIGVMGMLWLSSLPLENNPFLDQHLFFCITAVALLTTGADRVLGFGKLWRSLPIVRNSPALW